MREGDVVLGLGCVNLGSASVLTSERDQVRLVEEAIDLGVKVFDTADVYGSGSSERLLGRALRGRHDEVVIATKIGYRFRERSSLEQRARRLAVRARPLVDSIRSRSPGARNSSGTAVVSGRSGGVYGEQCFEIEELIDRVSASSRRLRVDRVDVLQLHGPTRFDASTKDLLEALRGRALAHRYGVGAESSRVAGQALASGLFDTVQLPYGLLDPEVERIVTNSSPRPESEIWVRGVLGGGLIKLAQTAPDRIDDHPKARYLSALESVAKGAGLELDELLLRWVAHQPWIDVVIFGASSRTHLRRNVELLRSAPLPNDLRAELRRLMAQHGV